MLVITEKNYVSKAEDTIKKLSKKGNSYVLTTSQIRNLLELTSSLYDESQYRDYNDLVEKINYLKVRFLYQSGRLDSVKELIEKGEIIPAIEGINDKDSLRLFCRYMEALVAYFKYLGGND